MLVVVHHTLDPPENLRARELDAHNVEAVKMELKTKGMLGARLDIICAAPPVSPLLHSGTKLVFFL